MSWSSRLFQLWAPPHFACFIVNERNIYIYMYIYRLYYVNIVLSITKYEFYLQQFRFLNIHKTIVVMQQWYVKGSKGKTIKGKKHHTWTTFSFFHLIQVTEILISHELLRSQLAWAFVKLNHNLYEYCIIWFGVTPNYVFINIVWNC